MEQLVTDGSFIETVTEDPPVGQWGDDVKLLNYPLDEKWPWQCEAYENVEDTLNERDEKAPLVLKQLYVFPLLRICWCLILGLLQSRAVERVHVR